MTTLLGVMLLLPLSVATAETSTFQEVISSSNSGGQGTATIEVTSTTIINGEESTYHFSTSTTDGVVHEVTIVDGTPVSSETIVDGASTSTTFIAPEYEVWITSLITLLNYLQLYVANTL